MPDHPPITVLKARWVFPVAGPPIAGGYVTVRGERLGPIGRNPPSNAVDLGDVAILPGLVNAHTHLEFSDLTTPLGTPGTPLPTWIRQVVSARATRTVDTARAIQRGLDESTRYGTTTLGEIATNGWTREALEAGRCDLNVFFELIGLAADRVEPRLADAENFVARALEAGRWQGGLSPHAPYSVHPELLVGLVRLAAANNLPVAMHVAESPEELELLASGAGPFQELLMSLGAWDPDALLLGSGPREYLRILATAPRALVIHGNYLNDDDRNFLAEHAQRMSLVFCPRTHAFFKHAPYPLEAALTAGVRMAVGTDSRASNPDLDLLAELRFVARHFPALPPATVLRMGTLSGAESLGRSADVGSLEEGKLANLAIVALDSATVTDPHELLFGEDRPVVATYVRGAPLTAGNS